MNFNKITEEEIGQEITQVAKVESITQTSGPTLFNLFDGRGYITAKGFAGPGKRAHSEIKEGDTVETKLKIHEYEGDIEAKIKSINKTDKEFKSVLKDITENKIKNKDISFLADSKWLEKMKPKFIEAATLIDISVRQNRPIIIRHNADCDGYSGAMALERSILSLMEEYKGENTNKWNKYTRAPSRSPYYTYRDATRDLSNAVNNMIKYNSLEPLIIIVDNGSGEDDLLGIQKVKTYNCPVIVVDHHYMEEDVISSEVDTHINPHLVGYNSNLCAGMLGLELSRFIDKHEENNFMAALAGYGDRVECPEFEQYKEIAKEQGYNKEFLKKLALCVDFEAFYLDYREARGLINDLYGANKEKQEELMNIIYPEAEERVEKALKTVKKYVNIEEKEDKIIAELQLPKLTKRGEFPSYGKITGITSDWLNEEKEKDVYVLGVSDDMVITRANRESDFNLHELISDIREEFPHADIAGGGHQKAGTIKFLSIVQEEIVSFIKNKIR